HDSDATRCAGRAADARGDADVEIGGWQDAHRLSQDVDHHQSGDATRDGARSREAGSQDHTDATTASEPAASARATAHTGDAEYAGAAADAERAASAGYERTGSGEIDDCGASGRGETVHDSVAECAEASGATTSGYAQAACDTEGACTSGGSCT